MERVLVVAAGLAGFAGVASGAAASHLAAGDSAAHDLLDIASRYLLIHAAALLGLGALMRAEGARRLRRLGGVAGGLLGLGVALFGGGIILHATAGHPVIDPVIPVGGIAMMLGWLAVIVFGACLVRRPGR
jgi:uncharacterized membrane protein YgdD (TMEM256/DUF423 family)